MKRAIIIGIGNSGRQDDGLGWAFLEKIEQEMPNLYDFEYRYQLQIEDAELISHYDSVLFVDADLNIHPQGFSIQPLLSRATNSYTSHELSPGTVLDLCKKVYRKSPDCYLLAISGNSFDLEMGLTTFAKINLASALRFFEKEYLQS